MQTPAHHIHLPAAEPMLGRCVTATPVAGTRGLVGTVAASGSGWTALVWRHVR